MIIQIRQRPVLLNRYASRAVKSPEFFDFIAERFDTSESGCSFDITVGPLMKSLGFFRMKRVPADESSHIPPASRRRALV